MDDDGLPKPPANERVELIVDLIGTIFADVPGANTIVNAFERSVRRVLRAKERDYLESVVTRLWERLDQHGERLDQLSDERLTAFISSLLYTANVAQVTTDRDKRLVLRNEAINSAMANAPSENMREMYLAMSARLTGVHLCIFMFLAKPEKFGLPVDNWRELEHYRSDGPWETRTWDTIQKYVVDLPDREAIEHCFRDLVNEGLCNYYGLEPLRGISFPFVLNLGWGFYNFIVDEDAENGDTRT